MRAQRQGGHQGDDIQKEDDVAGEEVGHIAAQDNFEIDPAQLIAEPESNAEKDERPEQPHAALGAQCQAGRTKQLPRLTTRFR